MVLFDDTLGTLPGLELQRMDLETMTPVGVSVKVLPGCRQLVPGGVGLSAITSATPLLSCHQVTLGTLGTLPP